MPQKFLSKEIFVQYFDKWGLFFLFCQGSARAECSSPSLPASSDQQKIDTLEQKAKNIASELYNKEREVENLTASNKTKESQIRSFAKKNSDLEKKVDLIDDENYEEDVQRHVVGQGAKKKPFSELGVLQKRRVTQPAINTLQSIAKAHQIGESQLVGYLLKRWVVS